MNLDLSLQAVLRFAVQQFPEEAGDFGAGYNDSTRGGMFWVGITPWLPEGVEVELQSVAQLDYHGLGVDVFKWVEKKTKRPIISSGGTKNG